MLRFRGWRYFSILFLLQVICFPLVAIEKKQEDNSLELNTYFLNQIPANDYIIGPGDNLKIIVSREYPELNVDVIIDGEGTIFLPKLNRVFVEGLSINELNTLLNKAFKKFVKYPELQILIKGYRPIRVSVRGEVENPGLKVLDGSLSVGNNSSMNNQNQLTNDQSIYSGPNMVTTFYFPTVFDALRQSGGITQFSDLSNIQIIRKNTISKGGGNITTTIDFAKALSNGDNSQNIRIYDSDIIVVRKNEKPNNLILQRAVLSNLNPKFINVFVTGRVNNPGRTTISKASTLNDAVDMAGGAKILKGKVTFIRFKNNGSVDRRKFVYRKNKKRGSFENPLLKNGDLIVFGDSFMSRTNEVVTEFTSPFVGLFSTYGLIKAISD